MKSTESESEYLHLRDLSLVLAAPGRVAHYTPPVAIDQSLFPLAGRRN